MAPWELVDQIVSRGHNQSDNRVCIYLYMRSLCIFYSMFAYMTTSCMSGNRRDLPGACGGRSRQRPRRFAIEP